MPEKLYEAALRLFWMSWWEEAVQVLARRSGPTELVNELRSRFQKNIEGLVQETDGSLHLAALSSQSDSRKVEKCHRRVTAIKDHRSTTWHAEEVLLNYAAEAGVHEATGPASQGKRLIRQRR
ncbi:hypothetical protein M407DRAFT_233936 [Tulasnella calospora MUT 4182]|uniref:Uncharacterized protein n=1 Tax=Tulasnella calospora MUT 4182 TaxID=1051891 RepID=A0A0C3Q1H4_9AGAM|nr:hypothetical protein M407DRAFT_233936 [Tulasnella calospora MUT 4182]